MKEREEEKGKVVQKFGHPITSSHTPCQGVCEKQLSSNNKLFLLNKNVKFLDLKSAYPNGALSVPRANLGTSYPQMS